MMTCVICDLQDKVISYVSQFQVRQCKSCGYYGMPEELVEQLQATGQRLNLERTKAFLTSRKHNQQPPWISVEDAVEHLLIELPNTSAVSMHLLGRTRDFLARPV